MAAILSNLRQRSLTNHGAMYLLHVGHRGEPGASLPAGDTIPYMAIRHHGRLWRAWPGLAVDLGVSAA